MSRPSSAESASAAADAAAPPKPPPGIAIALFVGGLLFALAAVVMLEQSARWLLTQATRDGFVRDELQIDALQDGAGEGRFSLDGRIVSSGELIHSTDALIVPLERLRALDAAGKIPGAREPVWYLPRQARWAPLHPTIRFRVQTPESFATNALGWTIVNAVFACAAVWLMRSGVRRMRTARE